MDSKTQERSFKFTYQSLISLKPPESPQVDYWDKSTPGFGVRLSRSGRRSWFVMYRYLGNSKNKRLTIGTDKNLSLADARDAARKILHEVSLGSDPAQLKKEERQAETFEELAYEYLERHAKRKKKTWKEDQRILEKDILPLWKNTKANSITRRDIRKLLDSIVNRGAPVLANRMHSLIRKVFNFAVYEEILESTPCVAIEKPAREKSRERVLNTSEINAVWNAIETQQKFISAMFKLHLLLGQRGGEIRSMEWNEIDLNTGWWNIPGRKTKNGSPHAVFLSGLAIEILMSIIESKSYSNWVFPSPKNPKMHINNIQKAFQRVREICKVQFVIGQDSRRTMTTYMAGLGIPREVLKSVINHKDRDVTAVYQRHNYAKEKQEAFIKWTEELKKIIGYDDDSKKLNFKLSNGEI